MTFHFTETARTIASHVAEGRSVRLVGGAGSGRSATLRQAARLIEARGLEVVRTPDVARPPQLPGFTAASLQLGPKDDRRTTMDLAISTRRALLESPETILLIDNADLIDSVSMEILDSVSPPLTSVRVVRTGDQRSKPIWPEVTVTMPELGFEEIAELLRDRLESGSPSASVTARVLSKSGGNPELAIAIAESALMAGLLRREDKIWRLASRSLWNEQLVPLVRWRIRDLAPDALRLLRSLSLDAPMQFAARSFEGQDEPAAALIAKGFLRIVEVTPAERLVHVWPPLIADLFTHEPGIAPSDPLTAPKSASWPSTASTTARVFQLAADVDARDRFRQWQKTPTTETANQYIARATNNAFDRANAEDVFAQTSHVNATREQMFRFEFQRAQWLALESGDLDAAVAALESVARNDPAERGNARAATMLLQSLLDAVPEGFDDELGEYVGQDGSWFVRTVLANLHFFSGDMHRARTALPVADGPAGLTLNPAILASLITAYTGDLRGAYLEALGQRNNALLSKDRTAFISASYVAVFATMFSGRFPQTEEVISSALGLAPVTMLARPVFGALLNISAGVARVTRRESAVAHSLALDVPNYAPHGGPLYGMGTDLTPQAVMAPTDRNAFDKRIAAGVRLRRSRGYVTAAWTAAVGAAAIDSGDEVVTQIEELSHTSPIPLFTNAARAASAVRHRRVDDLNKLVMSGAIDQDAQMIAQIVRAGQRRAAGESHPQIAESLEPIARRLEDLSGYPISALAERFESGERLSPREREIALLAGGLTNAQIALRLNISVRTVEHHISNGLHKIGRQSRGELAAAASEDDD